MGIVGGDFNTRMYSFKHGRKYNQRHFFEKDVKPHNGKYTWSKRKVGGDFIAATLDRFLIHSPWLIRGIDPQSSIAASGESDHRPILLFLDKEDLGPIPFRFNPGWVSEERVSDLISLTWRQEYIGPPAFDWEPKIKAVKQALHSC